MKTTTASEFKLKLEAALGDCGDREVIFYDYIESWADEGTYRYLCDIESEKGEVLENVLGLICKDESTIYAFANAVRELMKDNPKFDSLDYEVKLHNC